MATVLGRRFLQRSVSKLKLGNVTRYNAPASVLLVNLNTRPPCFVHKENNFLAKYSPIIRSFSQDSKKQQQDDDEEKKLSVFQRFKLMYKNYWYVLVPVHCVTSVIWFGGFYYAAVSGVDIIAILQSLNISDKIVAQLKDSKTGYLAVSYICYKLATPLRYTVTLGGTTISINYLTKWGYIKPKPIPSGEKLKEMYNVKKDNLMETMRGTKEGIKEQTHKLKNKKEQVVDDFGKSIKEIGAQIKSNKKNIVKK